MPCMESVAASAPRIFDPICDPESVRRIREDRSEEDLEIPEEGS